MGSHGLDLDCMIVCRRAQCYGCKKSVVLPMMFSSTHFVQKQEEKRRLTLVKYGQKLSVDMKDLVKQEEEKLARLRQLYEKNFVFEAPIQTKIDDSAPLEAEQEDPLTQKTPFVSASGETTIVADVPKTSGPVARNWTVYRNEATDLRLVLKTSDWETSKSLGDLITGEPVLLPHAFFTDQVIDEASGNSVVLSGYNQFAQAYQSHGLYRSAYKVFVSANGTQFHSGSLFVVAVPQPHVYLNSSSNSLPSAGNRKYRIADVYNQAQLGIFPSGRILPRSNNQLELDLPYVGRAEWKATAHQEVDYALFVFVETKLGVSSGSTPTLKVVVEAAPDGATFCAPKRIQAFFKPTVGNFLPPTNIPAPAQFETPTRVIPGVGAIASENPGTLQSVGWKPDQSLDYLPPRVENFQSLLSRPTVKALFDVGTAVTTGTLIAEWDVSPINNVRNNNASNNVKTVEGSSFLETFSRFFLQWRGSILYTLEWTGPAVSSGRFLLAFQPAALRESKTGAYGPQLPTGQVLAALSTGPHVVWDLAQSTSVTLPCDFAVPTPWAAVNPLVTAGSSTTQSVDNGGIFTNSISGTAYLVQLTPIVTPQTTQTTFQVVLHESAGHDFNLRYFAPRDPTTLPIYNGVLDQGPVLDPQLIGEEALDDSKLSVEKVLRHPRLLASGTVQQNKTLVLPLTLISYGSSTNTAKIVAGRVFPSLFTEMRADLRILVVSNNPEAILVAYRPPGTTDTVFGEVPTNTAAITNANWTIVSLRADNAGFELFVPYPGLGRTFQTSLNTSIRSDVVYEPTQDQSDPGSLGSILVIPRGVNQSTPNTNVWVFVGFHNVSAFVPRPFGPLNTAIPAPTMLADHEDFEESEEISGCRFEAPLRPLKEIQARFHLSDEEMAAGVTEDGWELQSLSDEMEMEEMIVEIEAEEAQRLFRELPDDYPEGQQTLGQWINGEWYRQPLHDIDPLFMWETPYSRSRLVYDPTPRNLAYETFWIACRRARSLAMIRPLQARDFLMAQLRRAERSGRLPAHLAREFHRAHDFVNWSIQQAFQAVREEEEDSGFFSEADDLGGVQFEAPLEPRPQASVDVAVVQNPVSESEAENGGELSEDDDEPPPKFPTPVVYKVNRGLYNHWGIAYGNTCISLRQVGINAVVSDTSDLDLKRARKHTEVSMKVWFQAVSALGMEFPDYNITHNCTHWTQAMSGCDLENSGLYLGLGLAVTAVSLPFLFQAPVQKKENLVAMESPLLNWEEPQFPPMKTTRRVKIVKKPQHRQHVFRRTMLFGKRFSLPRRTPSLPHFEAPININVSSSRMETQAEAASIELRNTLKTYQDMAPTLSAAITNAAASFQDSSMKASEFINKMEKLVDATTDFLPQAAAAARDTASGLASSLSRRIGSMLLKVIGYVLIIFGNPNPATIAGVIALMASEAMDSRYIREKIKSAATCLSHKLQALFCSVFGLKVCDDDPKLFEEPEVNQAYQDYMRERVNFEAPATGLQTFNQGVLAMKNVEWIIEKIKDLIDFVISKLKGKKVESPESYLESRADYIVKLYDDSVESGSCQNIDQRLLEKRLNEANEMLSYCVNHKLTSATPILARTVTNYRTTKRKLAAASYEDRAEPLVVYIHGGPGVGKSVLSNVIARAYCKRKGLPFNSSVFTTPPGSEYFDGYTGQPVHIIDDFCQNTTGEDVKLFCQMVSTTRFSPPMAALEEKGVNYCSKLIIATSNLATPQSNEIRIPAALERRCHIKVRTILHPAFSTPQGRLDMTAAFKPLGPAKSADFKQDCAYLNGAAITASAVIGEERKSEKMSIYELMEVIYEELDRREQCQDVLRGIVFEAPRPEDVRCYADGVIPTLCTHQDHEEKNCHRVFFRQGDQVWHRDFLNEKERRTFMEGYHLGKLPEGDEVRPCSCGDSACGKLLFLTKTSAKTFDFRSRSAMDYFLFCNGKSFKLYDPEPFQSTVVKKEEKPDVDTMKKELLSLKKKCMISFAITALGAVSSIIAAVVYLCKRKKNKVEAAYSGMPGQTKQKDHPRPLPIRNVKYEAPMLPQIYNRVHTNVVSLHFDCPNYQPFDISGVGLFDRYVATCHHAMRLATHVEVNGVRYKREDLNPVHISRGGKPTDLVFFQIPDGNQFKDITRYLISVKDKFPRDDAVLVSRAKKMVCNMQATNVRGMRSVTVDGDVEQNTFANVVAYDCPTMPGLCGAPLLSKNGAREAILGIHFAGTGSVGLAVPIYKEDLKVLFEGDIKPIEHPGKPTHVPRKSNLQKSPAFGAFPVTHEPACLTKHDKRLKEGVDLDTVMFSKHTGNHPGWKTLDPAMAYVVNDLMAKLGFSAEEPIGRWTMEEAINGSGCMDPIPMNQSPGYPYNTEGRSRRSFFEWRNEQWEPTDELRREVERALEKPEDFYFSTFLKDEIRPRAKVEGGKTRLVDGDALPRVIAYRMVFGPLFERMIAKNGPAIHSAVGCDPDKDWTRFFHELGPAHYPYVFDLDYSCFDSSEPAVSFELMAKYFKPYFKDDVTPFFLALARSKHVYEGAAFLMEGGMPSGCVGTSMFNCVNNSAFIVSALMDLKIKPEDCAWLCYGDDVIIATHEKRLSKRIAEFYARETPLVVTPASKSGDFPEVSTIYEVTFLKRFFQPDSAYPDLIHPYMPLDHLQQSVMWKTDGPFQAKIDSLCLLAFHAGGPAYREFVRRVDQQCRQRGENFQFRPFEYLMAVWYGNFF
uniref:Genome polyprotein n=1 Tax=Red-capped plover megrivirus TaxID=2592494 RepID=A0A5B8KAS7_9PICO|nr:polyprotein [Red-capped plover megrivirus]